MIGNRFFTELKRSMIDGLVQLCIVLPFAAVFSLMENFVVSTPWNWLLLIPAVYLMIRRKKVIHLWTK